ncbi:hypothetical protein BJ508DRAFT_335216 [Ascobolus immersus RN42]|uniref:F-box domain-containing protein n=1 Tax=Ascobolus immersus RN42 TaxID=1160509 RepID=A0A3N4HJA4_ASCIM|nr:hypothetical protein BJ508DRAFT_335216 [Ascobolus immersus RN42]
MPSSNQFVQNFHKRLMVSRQSNTDLHESIWVEPVHFSLPSKLKVVSSAPKAQLEVFENKTKDVVERSLTLPPRKRPGVPETDFADLPFRLRRKCTLPVILKLPNGLLAEISTHIDDPKGFLALGLVNKRFKSIIKEKETKQRFARRWFSAHCNNVEAPSIIEYIETLDGSRLERTILALPYYLAAAQAVPPYQGYFIGKAET